ncbi:MAG: hypothetical protein AAGN35_21295 [Bacteroidota bacterium]
MQNPVSIHTLRQQLPHSNGAERRAWAERLIAAPTDLRPLLELLRAERPVASRTAWLISDLADLAPARVLPLLPEILAHRQTLDVPGLERSLAKWWHLCGIPELNLGEATDLLFQWLADPKLNVSTKHHCLEALLPLMDHYPELRPEFILILEAVMDEHSAAFRKKAQKVLAQRQSPGP